MELAVERLQCRLRARRRYSRERAFQSCQPAASSCLCPCRRERGLSLPARAGAGARGSGGARARAREEWRARGARGARGALASHTSKLEVSKLA